MAKKENQADFMKMFNEEPQTAPVQPLPKKQLSPVGYEKKKQVTFAMTPSIRSKLDDIVEYYSYKSASAYLEEMIDKEWQRIQS